MTSIALPRETRHQNDIEAIRGSSAGSQRWNKREVRAGEQIGRFLERFKDTLTDLRRRQDDWEAAAAPDFNLFRVLRIDRREVQLHSRFIAELLNPSGFHRQGDRFMKHFLDVIGIRDLGGPTAANDRHGWKVSSEETVEVNGQTSRLDIVVRNELRGLIMVTENKVDAREQEDQLGRYAAWLDTQTAFSTKRLLFLTPDGRPPQTAADRCRCVSYREHMRSWLERVLTGVLPETVHFAVQQYLQTVESLSGGPMSTTNASPIMKALMKEENLPAVLEIVRHAEQIREQVMVQFWRGLEGAIRKQQPAGLPIEMRRVSDDSKKRDSGWGALEVRAAPTKDQAQGLYYALEAWRSPSDGNMCTTVFWQRDAGESLAALLGLREVRELQAALNKCAAQSEGRVEPEPKPGFLWAQYWWEFRPGESVSDPLSWFANESRSDRHAEKAARYWNLIAKTHKLLVKANEAVRRV